LGFSIAEGLALLEGSSRGSKENLVGCDFSVVAEWSDPADLDVGSDDLKCRSVRLGRSLRGVNTDCISEQTLSVLVVGSHLELVNGASLKGVLDHF
jgi:hypothetical protein